jgi:hypothetical protein
VAQGANHFEPGISRHRFCRLLRDTASTLHLLRKDSAARSSSGGLDGLVMSIAVLDGGIACSRNIGVFALLGSRPTRGPNLALLDVY